MFEVVVSGTLKLLFKLICSLNMDNATLDNRIDDIEARLIEQDHRPIHIITTFLKARRELPHNDPRLEAALKAMLWRVFFSPGTLAATGGLIALISVAVLVWQNYLIREQNEFLKQEIIQTQISNETEIIFSDYDLYPPERKTIAALELIRLSKILDPYRQVKLNGAKLAGANFSSEHLENIDFSGADLRGVNFNGAKIENILFENVNFSIYQRESYGSMITYYTNFSYASVENSYFFKTNLYHVDFSYSDLTGTIFSEIGVGESSGVIVGDTDIREFPHPLMLETKGLDSEMKRILGSQYQAIFEADELKQFIQAIHDVQTSPSFPSNGMMVHRNLRFYQQRLLSYRAYRPHLNSE